MVTASNFFYQSNNELVASKLKVHLPKIGENIFSKTTLESPRAVGDALQVLVSENFSVFIKEWCQNYSGTFARRSMADLAFEDNQGYYNVVDVKTHRKNSEFNMPALTSVKRLSRLYEEDTNIFSILMITYTVTNKLIIDDILFYPIEFFDWGCLTIGALGWGQIQIKDSNIIKINKNYSRKQWMLSLCELMFEFYPNEINKITERIDFFKEKHLFWKRKTDIWD